MNNKKGICLGMSNMPQAEMPVYFPYDAPIEEQVYDSLHGFLIPECALPWVENIFVPGKPCYEAYNGMRQAYERLLERLGMVDEDEDAEKMINGLLDYCQIISYKMFEYGQLYERRYCHEKQEKNDT